MDTNIHKRNLVNRYANYVILCVGYISYKRNLVNRYANYVVLCVGYLSYKRYKRPVHTMLKC